MGDGSNLGIDAERALDTILGGKEQPTTEERQTKEQVRERIAKAYADCDSGEWPGYGEAADITAGAVLAFLEAHPEAKEWPIEQEYERDPETGRYKDPMTPIGPNLFRMVRDWNSRAAAEEIMGGITGFQWGWAANTARWCFDLPEQPNPAIMTVNVVKTGDSQ